MAIEFAKIPSEVGADPEWSILSQTMDQASAPLPNIGPSTNEDNEDNYMRADASVLAIGGAIITGLKWLGNKLLGEVGEQVSSRIKDNFKKLIPKPLTSREASIYETLYESPNFSSGVAKLIEEWPEMTPSQAIKYSFEFLYRHNPRHDLAKMNPNPFMITADDVRILMERHGYTPINIYNLANEVAKEYGAGDTGRWNEIYNAILDAKNNAPRSASQQKMNKTLTESQQLFLKELRHEQIVLQLDTIKDVLRELSESVKATPSSDGTISSVKLGQFEVDISPEVIGRSSGRFAIAELFDSIATKIETGVELDVSDNSVIEGIMQKNPVVQKIIDARTNRTVMNIKGTDLALEMVEKAQLGEYPWFMRILREMYGKKETARVGIVVKEGGVTKRYEFESNGSRTSLYVEGEPHPIKPLSFSEGRVFIVNGDYEIVENAVMITDGRSRSYFITASDMEHYRTLARDVLSDAKIMRSNAGRAFLRFFNRLQSVWTMVYGERYTIEAGSPRDKVKVLAEKLGREQWSIELQQRLDEVVTEFSDIAKRRPKLRTIEPPIKAEETRLEAHMRAIRRDFIEKLAPQLRQEFKKLTIQLEKAVAEGDTTARNSSLADIRALMAKQLGEVRQANVISLDLYEEAGAWRDVPSAKELSAGPLPERLRNIILARGVDETFAPKLQRAREYAKQGSNDMAFLEYDRIVADGETETSVKMMAQAEKASLAVEQLQFQRAKRAVDWIEWMKASGKEVPAEAAAILEKLPPLNGGQRVVVKPKQAINMDPADTQTATTESSESGTTKTGRSVAEDVPMDIYDVKPPAITKALKAYNYAKTLTYDITGPAIFGAMTFLSAQKIVELVGGQPSNQLEAVAQGYTTIATAVVLEKGLQKTAETLFKTAEVPMGLGSLAGSLGASSIIYKGIDGAAKAVGVPEKASQMTSLVGTGVVYGAWKPIIKSLFSPEKAMMLITETEKIMAGAGIVYLVADAAPTVIEATVNVFDDDISVQAREEWYISMKEWYNDRGIFGKAKDVKWYKRVGNSIFNVLDTFVPAAWHKFADPAIDSQTSDWIATCRWKLQNGYVCR